MSTATAEKTETVRFISRSPNQVLTRRPTQKVPNGFGGYKIETRETYLRDMADKNEERERNGIDLLPVDDSLWKIEFENHIFETDDARLVAWLRSQSTFKSNGPSGFYEEPPIVDPVKEMAEPMKRIAVASVNADLDALVAIKEAEYQNDEPRPEVTEAVDAAIRAIAEEPPELGADAGSAGNGDPSSTSQP